MNFFEFTLWALAILVVGVPAMFCLTCIILAWIDARAASQAQPWGSSQAVGTISQYPAAVEEPEEEA